MYSPGDGRDKRAFNVPAINFNQILCCCAAWIPRLLPASPSPLSPMSTSTTCLHMQSLSECTMSFLLGSAASFTVDWFLFRSRGQATGVGNGPDVRCMVEWQRCSRSTCPGCREGAGALLAALRPGIPLLGGGERNHPPHPSRRHRGLPVLRSQCSPICSGASRNQRSALGRGRLGPPWSNLLRSASPLPAPSLRPDAHRRPQRSDTTRHLSS
ncbi:uncharacterized protein LOC114014827 isoform X2 [Falco cherrug]|uniref:uncharacterized protein LOC114014827 isoform X2 n=1 Tax=Falco cherrug TaxID=345164 RepID=UPI002479779F|nr:uncharacterized protein LOC114014827 isoform X2 [Falco cherrug]